MPGVSILTDMSNYKLLFIIVTIANQRLITKFIPIKKYDRVTQISLAGRIIRSRSNKLVKMLVKYKMSLFSIE